MWKRSKALVEEFGRSLGAVSSSSVSADRSPETFFALCGWNVASFRHCLVLTQSVRHYLCHSWIFHMYCTFLFIWFAFLNGMHHFELRPIEPKPLTLIWEFESTLMLFYNPNAPLAVIGRNAWPMGAQMKEPKSKRMDLSMRCFTLC